MSDADIDEPVLTLHMPRSWVEDLWNIMLFENEDEGAEPDDHERRLQIEEYLYEQIKE